MDLINLQGKMDLLSSVELFSTLAKDELQVIARYSSFKHFHKNQAVFLEGYIAKTFFLIKQGSITIRKKKENGLSQDMAKFIKGEGFGELDLMQNSFYETSAFASSETDLLVFPSAELSFEEILQKHPHISLQLLNKLLALIAGRIRQTNKLISAKTPWIQELRKKLLVDKLTGLYNRTYLYEDFPALLNTMDSGLSLLFIKPDNFKIINDEYGHGAGDQALRLIAIFTSAVLGEGDIMARFRGDENIALLPGCSIEKAKVVAKEISESLYSMELDHIIDNDGFRLSVSIAIIHFPESANNIKDLISIALAKIEKGRIETGGQIYVITD